jgi:hypothetical protein
MRSVPQKHSLYCSPRVIYCVKASALPNLQHCSKAPVLSQRSRKPRTFLNCHKLFPNTVSISLRAKIKPALDKPCRYFTFCTVSTPEILVAASPLAPILFLVPSLPPGERYTCSQANALCVMLLSGCFDGWDGMGAFGTFCLREEFVRDVGALKPGGLRSGRKHRNMIVVDASTHTHTLLFQRI